MLGRHEQLHGTCALYSNKKRWTDCRTDSKVTHRCHIEPWKHEIHFVVSGINFSSIWDRFIQILTDRRSSKYAQAFWLKYTIYTLFHMTSQDTYITYIQWYGIGNYKICVSTKFGEGLIKFYFVRKRSADSSLKLLSSFLQLGYDFNFITQALTLTWLCNDTHLQMYLNNKWDFLKCTNFSVTCVLIPFQIDLQ